MKHRFTKPAEELTLPELFRALANLADRGVIESRNDPDYGGDVIVASNEFSGAIGKLYEPQWIYQLVDHYRDDSNECSECGRSYFEGDGED